jgi:hypothetical protein
MLAAQQRLNRENRDLWDSMAPHRRRVTREVLRLAPRERVCILGAGNCNDLDLGALRTAFGEIHLVDLDGEALALGMERQGLSKDPGIRPHPGVDVAGLSELGTTAGAATDSANVSQVLRTYRSRFGATGVPRCDAVVSCCILSQLIETLANLLGTNHPRLKDLVVELREAHLDLMLEQTCDGGSLLFISDIVSSDTAPELLTCPDAALAKLRDELVSRNNYFHGTNPHLIERSLTLRSTRVERRPPWRWPIGERSFLVTAIRVDRHERGT